MHWELLGLTVALLLMPQVASQGGRKLPPRAEPPDGFSCPNGYTYCPQTTGSNIARYNFCDADSDCYGDTGSCRGMAPQQTGGAVKRPTNSCMPLFVRCRAVLRPTYRACVGLQAATAHACILPPMPGIALDLQGVFVQRHTDSGNSTKQEAPPETAPLLTVCGSPALPAGADPKRKHEGEADTSQTVCCSVGPGIYSGDVLTTCPCPPTRFIQRVDIPEGCTLGIMDQAGGTAIRTLGPGNHSADWFDVERLNQKKLNLTWSSPHKHGLSSA